MLLVACLFEFSFFVPGGLLVVCRRCLLFWCSLFVVCLLFDVCLASLLIVVCCCLLSVSRCLLPGVC